MRMPVERGGRTAWAALAALTIVHFSWLAAHHAPAISTPDANSYFAQARRIAHRGTTSFALESPVQFVGPHWYPGADGRYYCLHPPGLGAVLAAPYAAFGYRAATWINPVLASLSLVLVFLLCLPWTGPNWALLAAALMAVNPMVNEHALFGDAHIAVQFFLLGALLCLMQMANRASVGWAAAAGLLAGAIPSLRYAETLLLGALCVFVAAWTLRRRLGVRLAVAFAVAAALPLLGLLVRNHSAYGGLLRTGYASAGAQAAFGYAAFVQHAPVYLWKLFAEGLGVLFPLGVAGIAALLAQRDTRAKGLLAAGLVAPLTLLYSAYGWPPDPQSMRFLIPTFSIYLLAGVWLLSRWLGRGRTATYAAVALLIVTAAWGVPASHMALRHLYRDAGVLDRITAMLVERVPAGSVVIAGVGVEQDLDFVGRWKLADANPARFPAPRTSTGLERPGRMSPDDPGPAPRPGVPAFVSAAWAWAGQGGRVFLLAKAREAAEWEQRLERGSALVRRGSLTLPEGDLPGPRGSAGAGRPSTAPRPGPNAIFDLQLDGQPLVLFELRRARGA